MNFGTAIKTGFKKYADFTGVASRSEYWYWVLFAVVVGLILGATSVALATVLDPKSMASIWVQRGFDLQLLTSVLMSQEFLGSGAGWSLAIALPTLAAGARRLRDAGIAPKRIWLVLLPFGVEFLSISTLFMMLIPLALLLFFAALGALIAVLIFMPVSLTKPSLSAEQGNRFL